METQTSSHLTRESSLLEKQSVSQKVTPRIHRNPVFTVVLDPGLFTESYTGVALCWQKFGLFFNVFWVFGCNACRILAP